MTRGSAWVAAGEALIGRLAARPALAGWRVRYDPPRSASDLTDSAGRRQAIWVDPDGDSGYELDTMPNGYREDTQVTLVFERIDPLSSASQLATDEAVSDAVGELLDIVTDTPRLGGDPAEGGWDIGWVRLTDMARTGGVLEDKPGVGRRAEVTVAVQASRC